MIKIFHLRKLLPEIALRKLAVVVWSTGYTLIHHCVVAALAHLDFRFLVLFGFFASLGILTALLIVMASAAASAGDFGGFVDFLLVEIF